jgi:hypothetical protein
LALDLRTTTAVVVRDEPTRAQAGGLLSYACFRTAL